MRPSSIILDSTLVTLLVMGGLSCTPEEDTGHDCDPGTHWDGSACVPDEADTDTDSDTDADTDSDTDADTDSDTDADTDSDADSDSDVDTDTDVDTGDSYTLDDFIRDLSVSYCTKMDECGWLDKLGWTFEECLAIMTGDPEPDCPDFDPVAARACIGAVERATCMEIAKGIELEVCDDVCGKHDTGLPPDTDEPPDTGVITWTEINSIAYGYSSEEWEYEIELIGWGSSATLDIYQNEDGSVWEEHHDLEQRDYDPDGAWDRWGITLPIVSDWEDYIDSVNTLFPGDGATEDAMTWMVTAFDMDGYFADCAVWGKRIEYYASYGCWEVGF